MASVCVGCRLQVADDGTLEVAEGSAVGALVERGPIIQYPDAPELGLVPFGPETVVSITNPSPCRSMLVFGYLQVGESHVEGDTPWGATLASQFDLNGAGFAFVPPGGCNVGLEFYSNVGHVSANQTGGTVPILDTVAAAGTYTVTARYLYGTEGLPLPQTFRDVEPVRLMLQGIVL